VTYVVDKRQLRQAASDAQLPQTADLSYTTVTAPKFLRFQTPENTHILKWS